MPEISKTPSGGSVDSALAWYTNTLGRVLGLNPAAQELQVEQLGAPLTDAHRAAVADLVTRRFRRNWDPASGMVSFDTVGDETLLVELDAEADPVIAQVARSYLDAAKAAIASIDPEMCVPGVCEQRLAGLLLQARATLDLLIAEAPRRRSGFQVFIHVDELTNRGYGLLWQLEGLLEGRPRETLTVAEERAVSSLRVARQAVGAFEAAITDLISSDEDTILEVAEVVRRCAVHVPVHVQRARRGFAEAGIGDCELDNHHIALGVEYPLGGATFDRIALSEVLRTLESEPARWPILARAGRPEQVLVVQESARIMLRIVGRVKSKEIVAAFKLREPLAGQLAGTLDRMCAYLTAVFYAVAQETPPPPVRGRRSRSDREPPPPDVAAMAR